MSKFTFLVKRAWVLEAQIGALLVSKGFADQAQKANRY